MSTPSIIVGQGNWGVRPGNLLGYSLVDSLYLPREFTCSRADNTATRVNRNGNIEAVNANVPRIDYFGGQAGLRIEVSAANGILNSLDTTTNWTFGAGGSPKLTSSPTDVIGITGNNLTVALSGGALGSNQGFLTRTSLGYTLVNGTTYTISFFIKKTASHTIGGYWLSITGAAAGDLGAGFNIGSPLNSGTIYTSALVTNRIRRIEQWGPDVYRCSETFTMTADGTASSIFFAPVASINSGTNPAVGSQLAFAAPQLEINLIPTSFIPTTSGPVTRNNDNISLSGVAGLIGQTEGTIYAQSAYSNIDATKTFVAITDGTTNNRIALRINSTASIAATIVVAGSVNSITQSIPAIPSSGVLKLALGYKANDYALAINGTIYHFTTTRQVPPTTSVFLGNNGFNSDYLNDRILAAEIYPTRLPNVAQPGVLSLQSLTAI